MGQTKVSLKDLIEDDFEAHLIYRDKSHIAFLRHDPESLKLFYCSDAIAVVYRDGNILQIGTDKPELLSIVNLPLEITTLWIKPYYDLPKNDFSKRLDVSPFNELDPQNSISLLVLQHCLLSDIKDLDRFPRLERLVVRPFAN